MNKIKLKLSGDDCGTITQLIQQTAGVTMVHPQVSAMVEDLMLEILEKTHGRSLWTDKKNTINITKPQARAFIMHFAQIELDGNHYVENLLRQLVAHINKELTNLNKKPVGYQLAKI